MTHRLHYIDNLKGVLILLVVLGHCIQCTDLDFDHNAVFRYIYSFHMPLFMCVSGFVSYKPDIKWQTVQKRFRQLIIPFLAWVALLLLAVSLVLLPVNNLFRCRIEQIRKTYWKSLDDMTGYYMDSLRGLTTLKLFDRDREHSRILGEKADILNKNINCFMKINFTSFLVTEALIYAALVIALVDSCVRITKGSITISQALIVLMLSYSYFSSAQQLMSASHSALTAISAAGKVEEILDTDTTRPFAPSLPEDKEHFNGIRMEHVSYGYEGRARALQDVSLTIPKGSVVALVGLSGCGKSTTASLLMRFCDAAAGHIYMDGKDYHSMKPEELRKHIAMVPQQVNLFSGTIRENLLLADPDADDQTLMEAVKEAGLLKFVQSLEKGLNSDVGNAGASLSGGQRQKIGIARALLSKAEYMIFDEATSSVDPESGGGLSPIK